jgi:hypothetical protein
MEVLHRGIELLRAALQFLLRFDVVLPPLDLIGHQALDVDCIVFSEGGGGVDVCFRMVDSIGCILAVEQLILDVYVLLDELGLVVDAGSAVIGGNGVGSHGFVDDALGGIGDLVGIAVLLS